MRFIHYLIPLLFFFLPIATYAQNVDLVDNLKNHVKILASPDYEGRGLGTGGTELARAYIAAQFEAAGLETTGDNYFHDFQIRVGLAWVPAQNIAGFLPGNDPDLRDEVIVLGAHYDHQGYILRNGEKIIYHGADDNASGVAVLIELAKYLSERRESLGRSVVFVAFDAEESGLHGARHFLKDTVVDHHRIKAMFSLDMVGMYSAYNGIDLKGIGSLEGGEKFASEISDKHGIRIKAKGHQIEERTDTWPFGAASIPAIHVFTGLKSPYHQPEDTYDRLDYEGMARIQTYMSELAIQLSQKEALEPSREFLSSTEMVDGQWGTKQIPFFNYGIVLHNGTGYHKYPDNFFRANSVYNFSGGVFAQFHLSRKFTLQPELLFDLNGSEWFEDRFRRQSLTAPLNLQYNLIRESTDFRVYVLGGGYYRYNFGGRAGGESLDYGEIYEENEFGYNLGLGVEIMRVHFGFTVRRALTDIQQQEGPLGNMRDANNYFTLGYRF